MTALADPFAGWRPTINLATDQAYARMISRLLEHQRPSRRSLDHRPTPVGADTRDVCSAGADEFRASAPAPKDHRPDTPGEAVGVAAPCRCGGGGRARTARIGSAPSAPNPLLDGPARAPVSVRVGCHQN